MRSASALFPKFSGPTILSKVANELARLLRNLLSLQIEKEWGRIAIYLACTASTSDRRTVHGNLYRMFSSAGVGPWIDVGDVFAAWLLDLLSLDARNLHQHRKRGSPAPR
jgi:hypothetical protein